ncbi:hypothetical protein [Ferruginibacter sp.]
MGDKIIPTTAEGIPTQPRPLSRRDSANGVTKAPLVPTVFYSATQDEKTGTVYLKLVNTTGKKQPVNINLNGTVKVTPTATLLVIKGDKPQDTNTITEPEKIIPVKSGIKGITTKFTRVLDSYSVSIIQLQTVK